VHTSANVLPSPSSQTAPSDLNVATQLPLDALQTKAAMHPSAWGTGQVTVLQRATPAHTPSALQRSLEVLPSPSSLPPQRFNGQAKHHDTTGNTQRS
jgi:hypothetical protein